MKGNGGASRRSGGNRDDLRLISRVCGSAQVIATPREVGNFDAVTRLISFLAFLKTRPRTDAMTSDCRGGSSDPPGFVFKIGRV